MTTTAKPRAAKRRKPKPKPMPVVITEQRRNIKDLTFFELGLLPFLYLEKFIKLLLTRLSPSTFK
tara:strand:+ start:175 stop:369 length:195 start_codon:yes stop_codon:yes gene_type:complete